MYIYIQPTGAHLGPYEPGIGRVPVVLVHLSPHAHDE